MKIKIIKDDVVICFETKKEGFLLFNDIRNEMERNGIIDTEWKLISKHNFRSTSDIEDTIHRCGLEFNLICSESDNCDLLITK